MRIKVMGRIRDSFPQDRSWAIEEKSAVDWKIIKSMDQQHHVATLMFSTNKDEAQGGSGFHCHQEKSTKG